MLKKLLTNAAETILQDAVHEELAASHAYRHLSNQMQRVGYFGAAKWFAKEADDELTHYQKIADYLNDRGCVAELPELAAVDGKVSTLQAALEHAYQMEFDLGAKYGQWYAEVAKNDPFTAQFLLFYLEKQVAAIGEYGDWLARLARAGSDECALLIIDKELGDG